MKKEELNPPAIDSAIRALRPGVERWDYIHNTQEFTVWEDSQGREPPTHDEIMDQLALDGKRWMYYEYLRNRDEEYGQLKDQLELIYKDIQAGTLDSTGQFATFINNIKEKHPKNTADFNTWVWGGDG
jgi:hypothetical protein